MLRVLAGTLVLSLILLAPNANGAWYSIRQFDPQGESFAGGMANRPGGGMYIATDSVDDLPYRTVQSFDSSGNYLGKIGVAEAPNDVAVSPSGNVYLADGFAKGVVEYTPSGSTVRTYNSMGGPNFQNLPGPLSVTASSGSLWLTGGTNQIFRYNTTNGQLVSQFTIPTITQTSGHWNAYASDIAIANNMIYVALAEGIIGPNQGNRILAFDFNGTPLGQIGSTGSGNGQFKLSMGSSLAFDSLGRLLVADTGNNRIQMFNPLTGQYLDKFGTAGTGIGQLNGPGGIGGDSNGNIWVADSVNGQSRIQIFSTVPEPGTLVLAGLGLVGLSLATRRRRSLA